MIAFLPIARLGHGWRHARNGGVHGADGKAGGAAPLAGNQRIIAGCNSLMAHPRYRELRPGIGPSMTFLPCMHTPVVLPASARYDLPSPRGVQESSDHVH